MAWIRWSRGLVVAAVATVALFAFAGFAAAQATATVAGTVKNVQGDAIPNATVTLVSESRGTTFETQSSATGDFVVPNIPGDTYTVRVTVDGFKTSERRGVAVSSGERVAVGTVTIEVGAPSETVIVSAEAPLVQSQTGERSFVVASQSVDNLPITGRNYASLAQLTPGTVTTTNSSTGAQTVARADGAQTAYLLDGVANVDPGNNQQVIQLSPDAIAQVRVVSTAYQAEYGRAAGIQILAATKSGTNQFRGSLYDLERRTDWNTNTWANQRNGNAKPVADQRDWGFTVGGPVGKPGGQNKLFFFFSEQVSPRTTGGAINRFRVPTALERQGDFSQSTDNTGGIFNLIRDSTTGLPCTAADTRGCFQDGGVLGRIPQDRLYQLGLNVLKRWPLPNTVGPDYNLETVSPDVAYSTYQHVIRVDYQISPKLRVSAKYAGSNGTVYVNPGTIPGFNDGVTQFPAVLIPSATANYALNSTTVIEATWGMAQSNEKVSRGVMMTSHTNKFSEGLGDFPTLYPAAIVPVGSYQEKVLAATKTPFYQNGALQLPPQFSWGSRIANQPANTAYPSFLTWQRTQDVALSVTKLFGSHTFKGGYQSQDCFKPQNVGTQTPGVFAPEGAVSFANDSNNPLDTGFGFANAAIGVFSSYQQQNALIEGAYVYHSKDIYLQDNWKVSPRLTLDYGMRFTHHGPFYDQSGNSSNFFPERWQASQAPLLYQPGCAVNVTPCPAVSRIAVNPASGASLGAGSAPAIGTIVSGTGVLMNGIVKQGDGIAKENYVEPAMVYGPRVGGAYDVTGSQRIVVRGGLGYFFDRAQGDSVFGQSGNPPTGRQATVYYSTLQSVAQGATALQPVPGMITYYYDAKIGSSLNWNGGVQMALPWSSSLDVSYVGAHNSNSIAFGSIGTPSGQLPLDRNAPDIGTAYLPQSQDPTRGTSAVPGATAFTTDLLRPYRGIGTVNTNWPRFHTQYDSMQMAFSRRMRNGWQAGLSWTLGLRFSGNTLSSQHVVHNADGTIGFASYQEANDALLSNVGVRRHMVRANFMLDFPDVQASSGFAKIVAAAANGWQLSGVLTAGSGAPYDATYSYQADGSNVNLTGSPSYAARIKVVGSPGSGCSSDQYRQFDATAFQGPTYNSIGNESGTMLLKGCVDHTLDLSLSRSIGLGGRRQVQFRLDAFNVLSSVVFNARQTLIQYNNPADPTTVRNSQYNADGSLNTARLKPANAGVGAVTGAQAMRTMQAQLRLYF